MRTGESQISGGHPQSQFLAIADKGDHASSESCLQGHFRPASAQIRILCNVSHHEIAQNILTGQNAFKITWVTGVLQIIWIYSGPSSVESVQFLGSPADRTAGSRVWFGRDHNKAGKGTTCYSTSAPPAKHESSYSVLILTCWSCDLEI